MPRTTLTLVLVSLGVMVLLTAGLPVPIGAVASDSMAPTLHRGDVYVALPPALAGDPVVGDIAVFRGPDGWVVHRLVDRTSEGFLTAGDANVFVDQADGAPPVPADAIEGVLPTVGGDPLAVPRVGVVPSRWQAAILGLGAVLVVGALADGRPPAWAPRPVHLGGIVAAFVLLSWVVAPPRDPSTIGSVVNAGVLPHVVLFEHLEGARRVTTAWPGTAVPVTEGWRPRPVLGWAPASVLEPLHRVDARAAVLTVALTSGALFAAMAAVVDRLAPGEVGP